MPRTGFSITKMSLSTTGANHLWAYQGADRVDAAGPITLAGFRAGKFPASTADMVEINAEFVLPE